MPPATSGAKPAIVCTRTGSDAAHVEVEREAELGVPRAVKTALPALHPLGDLAALFGGCSGEFRDPEQRLVGGDQDAADQDVLDQERVSGGHDHCVVVTSLLEQLDQPEIAVVLLVRRALRGILNVLQIESGVRLQLADLDVAPSPNPSAASYRVRSPKGGRS